MRTVSVRALERGLAILEYLNKWNGARVADIMEVVGAPHATTYRLLKTLRDQGLLTKGNDRGEYWLSAGVKALSSGYKADAWLTENVQPIIETLAGKLHWPVFLMQPRGTGMVVRAKNFEPCPLVKGEIPTGTLSGMTSTAAGLVYLAHSGLKPPHPVESRKLAGIRRRGCADLDEGRNHVVQLAVPLRGANGLWGALMCRYNARAFSDKAIQKVIVRELAESAGAIGPYLAALPPVVESAKPTPKPAPKRRAVRA